MSKTRREHGNGQAALRGLSRGEYQRLHGCALSCSHGNRPSQEALLIRWESFKKREHIG